MFAKESINNEFKRVKEIDNLRISNRTNYKNTNLLSQKRQMLSITRKKDNTAFLAIKHHKIYVLAEDNKYIFCTVRSHKKIEYDSKFEGMEITYEEEKNINFSDDVVTIIRKPDSGMFGKIYTKQTTPEYLELFTDINGRKEYVIKNIIFALPKENLSENISFEKVSEIDNFDKKTKSPIEDYERSIKNCKEFILYDQESKFKSEQLVYYVIEKNYEVINTKEGITKVNMLKIEKSNNLIFNKEKDCYEKFDKKNTLLKSLKSNIDIE